MDEFDWLVAELLNGNYLSTYIATMNDGTYKIRFKCGNNSFITKRSFASIKDADEWAQAKLAKISDELAKLGYVRRTDAHPN